MPGAKLLKPKMYMTPRKMEELRGFIDKNLARGFFQPAKVMVAACVFVREKKKVLLKPVQGSKLRPVRGTPPPLFL